MKMNGLAKVDGSFTRLFKKRFKIKNKRKTSSKSKTIESVDLPRPVYFR